MPKKGYKQSSEHIAQRIPFITGANQWLWKGGVSLANGYSTTRKQAWRARNREKYNAMQVVYMHNRNANLRGNFTMEEWEDLKKLFNYTCTMCQRREPEIKLTVDHKTPVSKGGLNVINNIQPLCLSCNCSKGSRILLPALS